MSVDTIAMQCPNERLPTLQQSINPCLLPVIQTNLSSTDSESDHGYVTPAENFADDEQQHSEQETHHPATHSGESKRVENDGFEVTVDPELHDKILRQVEWYFSDENLLKDSFLMKHINRNKQGYVSLKLVASLRKVKALTKDWRIVLMSIKQSTELALNEEESKVRRITATPQVDYTHAAKTVCVTNYPDKEPTVQETTMFRKVWRSNFSAYSPSWPCYSIGCKTVQNRPSNTRQRTQRAG
jgi:hypothetical protein